MSEVMNKRFSKVYRTYDLMNALFTFGIDSTWRMKMAEKAILNKQNLDILDVAAGTGQSILAIKDQAIKEGSTVNLYGVDFNKEMLSVAENKLKKKNITDITLSYSDALHLNFPDQSFDVITSSFALRDFDDLGAFFKETARVLKRDGRIVMMDMAMPDNNFQRSFFNFYFKIMITLGSFVNKEAYQFLVDSIKGFDKQKMVTQVREAGFVNIKIETLFSGVTYIVTADKKVVSTLS